MIHRHLRLPASTLCATVLVLAGCQPPVAEPDTAPVVQHTVTRPAPASPPGPRPGPDVIPSDRQDNPRYSYDTEKDRQFADFLRDKSGGMVRQAAVGIEREGKLRVQVDRSVSPDDTLPLTRSILAGARKDFPGKAFTLSVYDPQGEPILRAHYDSERGVRYQVVHDDGSGESRRESPAAEPRTSGSAAPSDPLTRAGRSESDRTFASWAEEHGRPYLRYVQADLERHGRLWFGVTREVRPADVPDLTRSLLEGAHKAFPRKEIVATVFDPEGERIGRAHLGTDGKVRWEH